MAYITRELERKFLKLNDFFKVILVTGARQVGKTTMLKHLAESDRTYVTMDIQWRESLHSLTTCCSFRPISRLSLLTRCRKHRSCSGKVKIYELDYFKEFSQLKLIKNILITQMEHI